MTVSVSVTVVYVDRRIEMMISDLAAKAAAREALRNDPSLPALPDEEELKAVQTVHEQVGVGTRFPCIDGFYIQRPFFICIIT